MPCLVASSGARHAIFFDSPKRPSQGAITAQAEADLLVIEKTQALLVWTLNHIAKFPRSHRYGIGLRLETRLSDILDLLLRAKFTKDRLPLLLQTNLELELLRFQFRTVKDIHCLTLASYGSAARFVNEIGQSVGGWIKQTLGRNPEATWNPVAGTGGLSQSFASRPQSSTP